MVEKTQYCVSPPDGKIRNTYHTQLAKMSFDEIFNLTDGVCFWLRDDTT